MTLTISKLTRPLAPLAAITALVLAMGGTWMTADNAFAAPAQAQPKTTASAAAVLDDDMPRSRPPKKHVSGRLNLNTASEEQLMLLPSIGPSKAERVVTWRKKNGGFKRVADLRRVKGFGYKTFKRLEPFLDIKGDTTLAPKR
ncbi:MAG: helix-hairpin-helix domain-containing protein [Deltaproteobacteria bacterium]|nr:helix-hairpin-helix domain-containing protein [Deltaproteobacteria bacterium]